MLSIESLGRELSQSVGRPSQTLMLLWSNGLERFLLRKVEMLAISAER